MEMLSQIILIMIVLELMESHFQKAGTLGEVISRLYTYYRQSIFLFFMVHPTFYFVLLITLYFKIFNFYILTILLFKVFDIFFKIELIKQYFILKQIDPELEKVFHTKMAPWMSFLGLFTYVPLLFLAISSS